jgi:hypothetical protein
VREQGMGRQAPLQKGLIMWYALIPLMTLIATALPSTADLYIYRDAAGKRVLSNQPPPPGAEVESQREATPAGNTIGLPSAPATVPRSGPAALRPAPRRQPSYVDLNPLELQRSQVEDSPVYWKKFVTGVVKNRSGFTTTRSVLVQTSCTLVGRPADTGAAYLGTIGPRGSRAFQIPIILTVPHPVYYRKFTPRLGPVSCQTHVTYDTQ